ncbi:MAG: radical SAM protein [Janibacter sp.]|nr:radical SAM protein [Janibacter sp.]
MVTQIMAGAQAAAAQEVRPSRFTYAVPHDDGGLVVYNSMRGAITYVPQSHADAARELLGNRTAVHRRPDLPQELRPMLDGLLTRGFIVPDSDDELQDAADLREQRVARTDRLELILMPTESCNFRCTYCYEDFGLDRMLTGVQRGVTELVRRRHEESGLTSLSVSWFGGEPLVALDVVENLSEFFIDYCAANDITYTAGMTTNGYLLTPETARRVTDLEVRSFQVTLDGPRHTHDDTRSLMGGQGSFDTIMTNLRGLAADTDLDLDVMLRTNFTPENVGSVPSLVEEIGDIAARDDRFTVIFRPVGRWGGPDDDAISACTGKDAELLKLDLNLHASDAGMGVGDTKMLRPGGTVCYAANPWSLVVRPNGLLNKCTVALRMAENMVGRLEPDGTLQLDDERMKLWTANDETQDSGCRSCAFRPSCQGAHCPLIRVQDGVRPCPSVKTWIGPNLQTFADLQRQGVAVVGGAT